MTMPLTKYLMVVPTCEGGHALYTKEVLTALCQLGKKNVSFELLTARGLNQDYRGGEYLIHDCLDTIKKREIFSNKLSWVLDRLYFYLKINFLVANWVRQDRHIKVVHFQEISILSVFLFCFIRYFLGRQVFLTVHNVRPHKYYFGKARWIQNSLLKITYLMASRLFVHSDVLKTDLRKFLFNSKKPIDVVPHGVWTGRGGVPNCELPSRTVLFYGTIRSNKGLHLLLDVFAQLPADVTLTIAGSVIDDEYYNEMILPRVSRLRTIGRDITLRAEFIPDDEVASYFSRASLLVLPYVDFAAQSGVLFDSISYGLPIVSSEVGAIPDVVRRYCLGETYPSHDMSAFHNALCRVLERNRESYLSGFEMARDDLNWIKHAEVLCRHI